MLVQKIDSMCWRIGARWRPLSGSFLRRERTIVAPRSHALPLSDAHFDVESCDPIDGADSVVALVRETLEGAHTVQHGHMGEIALTGASNASGTWGLADYVEWDSDGERRGIPDYGRYEASYREEDGRWRIASLRLRYPRIIDPLPRGAPSGTVLSGPRPRIEDGRE